MYINIFPFFYLSPLLFASWSLSTSPTYSQTNVPRAIGSPARTPQPWSVIFEMRPRSKPPTNKQMVSTLVVVVVATTRWQVYMISLWQLSQWGATLELNITLNTFQQWANQPNQIIVELLQLSGIKCHLPCVGFWTLQASLSHPFVRYDFHNPLDNGNLSCIRTPCTPPINQKTQKHIL